MENDFLKDLNPQQRKAVLHTDGPTIILAGAGSGKTRVLTYKVVYLINKKHIAPENILMISFTNKAAGEMKERMQKFLPTGGKPLITTFHSFCAKVLRIEGKHIGLSEKFVIYDGSDQLEAIKQALSSVGLSPKEYKPGAVLGTISHAKNELITPQEYLSMARGYFQQAVAQVYLAYQKILKESEAMDFDDLIFKTVLMFQKNPEILEKYQNKFRYILIDEYQDTNRAQYVLTKLLAKKNQNICVVGDFSQSIYSWRGADFQNLSKFKDDFANVTTLSLDQNYRSTQKILDAASTVIAQNTTHPVLSLWTENGQGENVTIYEARNEQDEAVFIAKFIKDNPHYLHKIAILYRTNAQSRVFEEMMLHHGLPYILVGGTRFYERKEIKDVLAYLRVLANPKDAISMKRTEKLGKGRLQKFLEYQSNLQTVEGVDTIDLLDGVMRATKYLELYDENDEEDRSRLENIKELRSVALNFPNITDFLENVALIEQEYVPNGTEKNNAVTMMTLHAAKGLEFPIVFMVGMEEGLFPHSRALMDKYELEEERRLC
ncbi:MAG TPA: UvrD-helicase domain-containing protein, partial [Candidatus Saccharimonadales bacterium]|nr:UvrD-helicase domain-containing protein [Candidatus Saccharimonadales bacterium]